jgi:Na+/H+ antiporter NhaD/arsenite permease-like protein
MVWQSGQVQFLDFLPLFLPSLACFLVPAFILSFFIPKEKPAPIILDVPMKIGSKRIIALGFLTIGLAILFEQVFSLPAFLGMMLGLGMLLTFGYFLKKEARPARGRL